MHRALVYPSRSLPCIPIPFRPSPIFLQFLCLLNRYRLTADAPQMKASGAPLCRSRGIRLILQPPSPIPLYLSVFVLCFVRFCPIVCLSARLSVCILLHLLFCLIVSAYYLLSDIPPRLFISVAIVSGSGVSFCLLMTSNGRRKASLRICSHVFSAGSKIYSLCINLRIVNTRLRHTHQEKCNCG